MGGEHPPQPAGLSAQVATDRHVAMGAVAALTEKKIDDKPSSPSLPSLLVSAIRSAGRPVTVKHLVQAVKRRGFKSGSAHFTKMVEARLWDLKKQGVVQRAADQPGYILAPSSNGAVPKPGPAKTPVQKGSAKAPAKAAKPPARPKLLQKPLREVLTEVLKKKGTPFGKPVGRGSTQGRL
jgi:hypothetical protein